MALFDIHHPWAFAFGLLGNIISFMVFLAPVPTFYRIYKKKSTEGFQSLPYLVALFSCMLWLYYALLKADVVLLITINGFGCVVETIYIAMYIAYASKEARKMTIKLFLAMNVGLFALIVLFTHFLVKGPTRVDVLGWINVAIAVSVFAAPLSIIAQVVRTKSVEFMPFNLSFFLTLSAVMWFGYGMLKHDKCVAIPNILGFLLGMIQMVLYAVYRNGEKKAAAADDEKKKKAGVSLNTMGNINNGGEQVHPNDDHITIEVKMEATANKEDEKITMEAAASDGSKPNDEAV